MSLFWTADAAGGAISAGVSMVYINPSFPVVKVLLDCSDMLIKARGLGERAPGGRVLDSAAMYEEIISIG